MKSLKKIKLKIIFTFGIIVTKTKKLNTQCNTTNHNFNIKLIKIFIIFH